MQPKTPKLLEDIRAASAFILEKTRGHNMEQYREDDILRLAIERQFEIIGEAMGRLARVDPQTAGQIGEHQQIISFRNVLIHGYDLIDDALVWKVITTDLPRLYEQVCTLLKEAEGND